MAESALNKFYDKDRRMPTIPLSFALVPAEQAQDAHKIETAGERLVLPTPNPLSCQDREPSIPSRQSRFLRILRLSPLRRSNPFPRHLPR